VDGLDSCRIVVGCQVCLATVCSNTGRPSVAGGFQEDGKRVYTDRSSQQRVYAEKALTAILQPFGPSMILPAATSYAR
jgi:hypothetical protein